MACTRRAQADAQKVSTRVSSCSEGPHQSRNRWDTWTRPGGTDAALTRDPPEDSRLGAESTAVDTSGLQDPSRSTSARLAAPTGSARSWLHPSRPAGPKNPVTLAAGTVAVATNEHEHTQRDAGAGRLRRTCDPSGRQAAACVRYLGGTLAVEVLHLLVSSTSQQHSGAGLLQEEEKR